MTEENELVTANAAINSLNKDVDLSSTATIVALVPPGAPFDPTAIEAGFTKQQLDDFRRAQLEGLRINKQKHEKEVEANWRLGSKIDTMMVIVETAHGTSRGAQAAAHCARMFGVNEKNVTDYRRFFSMFPDVNDVKKLINMGPSWTVMRHFLQYSTPEARAEALSWLCRDNRFITAGDLARITDAVRKKREEGTKDADLDMVAITNEVFEVQKDVADTKQKAKDAALDAKVGPKPETPDEEKAVHGDPEPVEKKESKPTTPKKTPEDMISTGKLIKQIDTNLVDVNGNLAVLVSRMYKVDKDDDDKAHKKLMNAVEDKILPRLAEAKQQIEAIEKMAAGMSLK